MGKGKGKGQGKGCFYSFIDDSYFAYYFVQWAIAFFIIGGILIIVGAVVGSLYPGMQYKSYTATQILSGGVSSSNYDTWTTQTSSLSYYFNNMSISNGNINCNKVGPFNFDVTENKVNVLFSSDSSNVTYKLQQQRSLRTGSFSTPLTLINPLYVNLVNSISGGEESLFIQGLAYSNFTTNYETFFSTTATKLIGARWFAQYFPETVQTVTEQVILPNIYQASTGLPRDINNYLMKYTITGLKNLNCTYCSSSLQGIYNSLSTAFIQNSECRANLFANSQNFSSSFVQGFQNLNTNTACVTFLKQHGLNSTLWANQETLALNILASMDGSAGSITQWYDLLQPDTVGYCNNQAAAASQFSTNVTYINDICTNFIPSFYTIVTSKLPVPTSQLGRAVFCTQPLQSTDPTIELSVLPTTVSTYFTSVGVSLNYTTLANYNDTQCSLLINTLSNVQNYVIPKFLGKASSLDSTLTSAQQAILEGYIQKFAQGYQRYFVNLWRTPTGYTCTPACAIQTLSSVLGNNFPNASVFGNEDSLWTLLFSTSSNYQGYTLLSNPLPILGFGATIFDPIIDATGALLFLYNLNQNTITGLFSLSLAQYQAVQNYVNSMVNTILQNYIVKPYSLTSVSQVGFQQFAQSNLACGPNSVNQTCSIEYEFFGSSYSAELGIVSYVTASNVTYPGSFTTADQSVRTTATASFAQSIFTSLQNPKAILQLPASDITRKYLFYVFNTYVANYITPPGSGLVATKTLSQFLNGAYDPTITEFGSANLTSYYAIDPSTTVVTYNIRTGAYDNAVAYLFNTMEGSTILNNYGEDDSISGLYNIEEFPPNSISTGQTVKIFEPALNRSFNMQFGSSQTQSNIDVLVGNVESSDWSNPKYTSTANFIPVPGSNKIEFFSPCGITLSSQCALGSDGSTITMSVEPKVGLVVSYSSCYVRSTGLNGNSFPISAANAIPTNTYSSVERLYSKSLDATIASSYQKMVNTTKNNSIAILAALIAVGALFIIVAIFFLVFHSIKKKRENEAKAKSDLVDDPFQESKNKNEVFLRD